jgi:hypothetical protein
MKDALTIKSLAAQRLAEARHLLGAGHWDGAYYLGGYAVELALKAIICKNLDIQDLYDNKEYLRLNLRVHDFQMLFIFSGLKTTFDNDTKKNASLGANWSLVSFWKETSRYDTGRTQKDVQEFLNAIDEPLNGIFTWLQKHW